MRPTFGLWLASAMTACGHASPPLPAAAESQRRDPSAIVLVPDDVLRDVERRLEGGLIGDAVARLQSAIETSPSDARAWYLLARGHERIGASDAAEEALRRTVSLEPEHADAWDALGQRLAASARIDEGVAAFRRALDARPEFEEAHYHLARALEQAGRLDEALAEYESAVRGQLGNDPEVRFHRASLEWQRGDVDAARAEFLLAKSYAYGNPAALHAIGLELLRVDALDAGFDALRQALDESTEPSIDLILDASAAATRTGHLDDALALARRAAELDPAAARTQVRLASASFDVGQVRGAREALRRARDLDSEGTFRMEIDALDRSLRRRP